MKHIVMVVCMCMNHLVLYLEYVSMSLEQYNYKTSSVTLLGLLSTYPT
jgi:predicted ferric reductase